MSLNTSQKLSLAGNLLTEIEVTCATKWDTTLISSYNLSGCYVFGCFHSRKQVHLILKPISFLRLEYSSVLQYDACGMGFIYFFFRRVCWRVFFSDYHKNAALKLHQDWHLANVHGAISHKSWNLSTPPSELSNVFLDFFHLLVSITQCR